MINSSLIVQLSIFIIGLYCVLIICYRIGFNRLLYKPSVIDDIPFISVVVAMKDEADNIQSFLNGLLQLNYPSDRMEILLVDDYSTDSSVEVAEAFMNSHSGFSMHLLQKSDKNIQAGKKAALELGVQAAKGELIYFTDVDCTRAPNILHRIAESLDYSTDLLLMPVSMTYNENWFQKFQALEFVSLQASTAGAAAIGYPIMANAANMAVKKEIFLNLNPYSDNKHILSGDDIFLLQKFINEYGRTRLKWLKSEEAIVETKAQDSIVSFMKQRMRWAGKTPSYQNWQTVAVAVLVFLSNLMLVLNMSLAFFYPAFGFVFLLLFLLKSLVDFPLMNDYSKFSGQQKLMRYFIPLQLLYPFYVVITAILSILRPPVQRNSK